MGGFSQTVASFWQSRFLSGEVLYRDDAFVVTVNSELPEDRRVMVLETAEGQTMAVVTSAIAERLGLRQRPNLSASGFREMLRDAGVTLHGADYLFYFSEVDKGDLLEARPDASCSTHVIPSGAPSGAESRDQSFHRKRSPSRRTVDPSTAGPRPSARDDGNFDLARDNSVSRLTQADGAAFAEFQSSASEDDLDAAYVELDHWVVFGAFERDRLVCAASTYPWEDSRLADLGVLTLPAFRGRGHALRVVRAICKYAIEQGYEPQYRCQLDNVASKALAEASGLTLFGTWDVVSPNSAV